MNYFLQLSIEYANNKAYLDDLFQVYPTIPEGIRDLDENKWNKIEKSYKDKDNALLIDSLLELELFPIKDSYVAYLRKDKMSKIRNPKTIDRLAGRLYEIDNIDKIKKRCSEPKETNRRMGQSFKNWIDKKSLGIMPVKIDDFLKNDKNAVLDASGREMTDFAKKNLGYNRRDKQLDFVGRFNKKYVIGEAKFLTDFGGHQNAQFADAISTLEATVNYNVVKIGILDGVLYINTNNKLCKSIRNKYSKLNIMSALVLRDFLYQL